MRKYCTIRTLARQIYFCVSQISWANDNFPLTRNNGDQELRVVLQVQTRVDIDIVPPATQTSIIQHGDHFNAELRFWHLDPISNEHERMIRSTQREMLRLILQTKRKYKMKMQRVAEKEWR